MFDLNSSDGSVRKRKKSDPFAKVTGGEAPEIKASELDKPSVQQVHRKLVALYSRELDRQRENRLEQAQDEDFYDNIQWSEEDAEVLRERGQVPLVYNVISASVDWVTGTEKRNRTDFKILPRRKAEGAPAERKTALMKYLSDVNREGFHVSRAFEDAVKVGVGWLEDGLQDEEEDEPLYTRYECWRNMLWDSASTEMDLKDARYVFRSKWVDVDVAKSIFKKRQALIDESASANDDFTMLDAYGDDAMDSTEQAMESGAYSEPTSRVEGYQRRRVRLIEAWIKLPSEGVQKIKGGTWSGEIYDPYSPAHRDSIESGEAEISERDGMRVYVAIFTTCGMLWLSESPYRHNRFPFTPIWAYRRGRDGMPYGMIRRLKDIQVDVNKRASKALHILSTSKIIMDEDAIPDDMTWEEFREEAAQPDAIIRKRTGRDLKLDADRDLSQWHLELMSRSIAMVQQASGVTDESLGRTTNAVSGKAITARQNQGSLATAKLFDNLLLANQVHGEKLLSNVEQFMSDKKAFRITNARGTPEYVEINDGLPDNDIIRNKADFIISESAWHASTRQAAADQLLEAAGQLGPQVAMVLLDLIVENMDLPNRDEIVKRIRQINKQRDPDADEPTEEEIAQAKVAQAAERLQQAAVEADIRKKLASAAKDEAAADDYRARSAKTQAETAAENVSSQSKAIDAAAQALLTPEAVDVADFILRESGFESRSDREALAAQLMRRMAAEKMAGAAPQPEAPQSMPQPGAASPPGLMQAQPT